MTGPTDNDDEDVLTEAIAARLLKASDDPRHLEAPAGFDFLEATERFLRLAAAVAPLAGGGDCEIEMWPLIQGAAFHGSVVVTATSDPPTSVTVRASNFGNMIAILGGPDGTPPQLSVALRRLFDRHGYRYVPDALLGRVYTGPHAKHAAVRDWRTRYFDYF